MQKYENLVELEKCCQTAQTHTFLQNFVLVQPRTSPPKKLQKKCNLAISLILKTLSRTRGLRVVAELGHEAPGRAGMARLPAEPSSGGRGAHAADHPARRGRHQASKGPAEGQSR